MTQNTNPARGMRDFLPADIRRREYVISIIKDVYQKYGFEPLETPAVENIETLMGKYGEEGNQLIFKILKRGEGAATGEADLALRYDLTVPTARVVAEYKDKLPRIFKRYQIQPVWRADRPARGRFREFYQCDVDVFGAKSMVVEAELCAAVNEVLQRLGFNNFIIRVNHRGVLTGVLAAAGVHSNKHTEALVALDKFDKIGREGVAKEFAERGILDEVGNKLLALFESFISGDTKDVFSENQKEKLFALQNEIRQTEILYEKASEQLKKRKEHLGEPRRLSYWKTIAEGISEDDAWVMPSINAIKEEKAQFKRTDEALVGVRNESILLKLKIFIGENEVGKKGIEDLERVLEVSFNSKVKSKIRIDPSLARGLSYYTGTIFEINVPDLAGSIGGGGRYDNLIGMFSGEEIPACGFSLGLERIIVVMTERGMFPEHLTRAAADVLVTVWNEETIADSLELANELRAQGLRVSVYPEADKLGKQLKYAASIGVAAVAIVGDDERANNMVTIKHLETGTQETIARDRLHTDLKI